MKNWLLGLISVAMILSMAVGGCAPAKGITWLTGCTEEGSIGYMITGGIATLGNRYVDYGTMDVMTFGTSLDGHKAFDRGEVDSMTFSVTALNELMGEKGAFAPDVYKWERPLAQWMWLYDVVHFELVRWGDRDEIHTYSDAAGRQFYALMRGTGTYIMYKDIYGPDILNLWDTLDVKEFPLAHTGDALLLREVDVVGHYGCSGAPSGHCLEALGKVKCQLVTPSDKELEAILAKLPLVAVEIDPREYFAGMDLGVDEPVKTHAMPHSFVTDPDMDEEYVYQIIKMAFENPDELKANAPDYWYLFAKDPVEFHLERFEMANKWWGAEVPIHRGVNRYFKEIGYDLEEMGFAVAN